MGQEPDGPLSAEALRTFPGFSDPLHHQEEGDLPRDLPEMKGKTHVRTGHDASTRKRPLGGRAVTTGLLNEGGTESTSTRRAGSRA